MRKTLPLLMAMCLFSPVGVMANEDRAEAFRTSFAETQERLDLTDAQLELIEPIVRAQFEATQAVMQKYEFTPGESDRGRASLRQMRAMGKEIEPIRTQAEQEMAAILSPSQLEEYREIQEERRAAMRKAIRENRDKR